MKEPIATVLKGIEEVLNAAPEQERPIALALARAVLCRILKLVFQAPSAESLGLLCSEEGFQLTRSATGLLGASEAAQALAYFGNRPKQEIIETYDRIFGHTARGRVCPYETEYGADGPFLQSQELADIEGYLLAFGLRTKTQACERMDHIAVELEFLEFLNERESYALSRNDTAMLEVTRQAYRSFLSKHLSRFGRAFSGQLSQQDPDGPYGALARVCNSFLTLECERLDIPIGPEFLPLRPDSLDDAPMACGSSDPDSGLIQIS